ncbi:MAG TPA: error-prone DNA polymerase, partial [Gammaproteobacteria bacterium]|nr:error-prone DNA polymerase [Gammaproteobacteria bacterium]
MTNDNGFVQLQCLTNYSFLRSASHPHELVEEAARLGYQALAVTDECSLAGIVKAHAAARKADIHLIIGSEFVLSNGCRIVALVTDKAAYRELSGFITLARRRAGKGSYVAHLSDLRFRLQNCLIIWRPEFSADREQQQQYEAHARTLSRAFKNRLWLGVDHRYQAGEQQAFALWQQLSQQLSIPLVACSTVLMHQEKRKPLHDVLTAIRLNTPVQQLGTCLEANSEAYLKPLTELQQLYAAPLLNETRTIAARCRFSMTELYYQYPEEVVPKNMTASGYLQQLVDEGAQKRWPRGVPKKIQATIDKELLLIKEMAYEYYFLTVYDIVNFARSQNILCQGRGSAANSIVCYCLFITEINPEKISALFERFISKERDEPPDIDVDFEHSRREEVIQYIYRKYGRERAALAATVITYRTRSALRDVGKALGLTADFITNLSATLGWWESISELQQRIEAYKPGTENANDKKTLQLFIRLLKQIIGFPRHLSQHVGGFVITQDKISDLVPLENAAMAERTIIQWDKEDLETMHLMKVDVLALGMLTALRKALALVNHYNPRTATLADIPQEDRATYDMLSNADSVGVFQIESRAQMSMLPRLKPTCFYDLVVQIAIVRPGPIQGDMVHPYLRRRAHPEEVDYPSPAPPHDPDELRHVLKRTLGVPLFQEQAMKIAIVAADFTPEQANGLRKAMATFRHAGTIHTFEEMMVEGMVRRGYERDFAERCFAQIKGFGEYGFPESHAASFAKLVYASAWIKHHHPAAFACGLLNSQPMGFYAPAQIVRDAQENGGVEVRPVDLNFSHYDNTLERREDGALALRLGFRQVDGWKKDWAEVIVARRGEGYDSVEALWHRSGL